MTSESVSLITISVDDFGARIKHFREASGLTQGELAESIGVGQSAVANWERGYDASAANQRRAVKALGLSWLGFWRAPLGGRGRVR